MKRGICLSALCPPHAAVEIHPGSFSFLILNLIQFAYLFEGTESIGITAEKTGKNYRLSLSFSDGKDLFSVLEDLLYGKGGCDVRRLFAAPLLCVLRLCGEDGIPWRLRREKERLTFSVLLRASDALPDSFFSQTAAEEVRELLRLEKEYFS